MSVSVGAAQICYLVPNVLMLHDPCTGAFKPWSFALVCVLIEWLLWGAILSLFLLDIHWRLPRTKERSSFVERIMLLRPPPPERPDSSFLDLGWNWRVIASKVIMYCVFEALFISTWVSYNRQPRLAIWHDACLQVRARRCSGMHTAHADASLRHASGHDFEHAGCVQPYACR